MKTSTWTRSALISIVGLGLLSAIAPAEAASPPTPVDDQATTIAGNGPLSVAVLANDSDPDGDSLTVTDVSAGHVADDVVVWNPHGFVGERALTYTVTDGQASASATLTVTVAARTGLPPVAVNDDATVTTGASVVIPVLGNDSDPENDSLQIVGVTVAPQFGTATTDGTTITYQSIAPFAGTDSLTYRITDGTKFSTAAVSVDVTSSSNHAPSAADDQTQTRWHHTVNIPVLSNDGDYDDDALVVAGTGSAQHGTTSFTSDSVTYTPRGASFTGEDQFTYTISDGRGGQDTALVTVTVNQSFEVFVKRPRHAIALHPTKIEGDVTTRDGSRVKVTVQHAVSPGRWRPLGSTLARTNRTFNRRWTPSQPGHERIRAVAVWATGHRDISPALSLTIAARFDPVVHRVTRKDVPKTWRPGCPVGPDSLRSIQMNYWDYHKRLQRGTLIGAAWAVPDYKYFFQRAFQTKFLIKKMYPADRYGGVDERAMRAGDTSAFNCRHVTGNPYRISEHSYGDAIDINTFENPYVTGSRVYPPAAATRYYFHRDQNRRDPGVISRNSSIAHAMFSRGWLWGARWSNPDYQHWSMNGG